jgi:hypothetical protein|eukprot:COSAG06_NODE_728_length_12746_cov_13.586068_7_plen_94_part_00
MTDIITTAAAPGSQAPPPPPPACSLKQAAGDRLDSLPVEAPRTTTALCSSVNASKGLAAHCATSTTVPALSPPVSSTMKFFVQVTAACGALRQ